MELGEYSPPNWVRERLGSHIIKYDLAQRFQALAERYSERNHNHRSLKPRCGPAAKHEPRERRERRHGKQPVIGQPKTEMVMTRAAHMPIDVNHGTDPEGSEPDAKGSQ